MKKLNLCENSIDEKEEKNKEILLNLRKSIDYVEVNFMEDVFNPNMNVGILFDVKNDVLSQLISFDNEKKFFENFLNELNIELISLINGKEDYPCYDIYALISHALNYLSSENVIQEKKEGLI